jgi:hypothetical protein
VQSQGDRIRIELLSALSDGRILIREATFEDAFDIGKRLRPHDFGVVSAYGDPVSVVEVSRVKSLPRSYVLEVDGQAEAMFGCEVHELTDMTYGSIWCVATPQLDSESRWLRRNSKAVVDAITRGCDVSGNVVDSTETAAHVRWLRWLGYEFGEALATGKLEFAKIHDATGSRSSRDSHSHHGSSV